MGIKVILWLDDIRDPEEEQWFIYHEQFKGDSVVWVKSYSDFTSWIKDNGLPYAICFDHDLGEDVAKSKVSSGMSKRQARREKRETMSGMDCAHWLVNYCMDNKLHLPLYEIQSANPVGKDNIDGLLKSYNKHSANE